MRNTITTGLLVAVVATVAGCLGDVTTAAPPTPVTKTVRVGGNPLELTVQSSFPGTASQVGPVIWVQVKLHNLANRQMLAPPTLPYKLVDASGEPAPGLPVTTQVLLHLFGYDADRPTLPDGLSLGPGETVVGYLAFDPPTPTFTPVAFRFDNEGVTDWQLAGLPAEPVVESVPPPAAAMPAGRTVTVTGVDQASESGPSVPTTLRVAVSRLRDADVDRIPPKGYRSVVGTIEITNTGRSPYLESVLLSLLLFDTTGYAFPPAPAIPPGMLREGVIAPGKTVRGTVGFFVPERARLSHIRFTLAGGEPPSTAWWLL